jgi:hypothetical protein
MGVIKVERIELDDNDVLSMHKDFSPTDGSTFKAVEALAEISRLLGDFYNVSGFENWANGEGIEAELLKPGGSGWQKGKVHFRIHFTPDDKEGFANADFLDKLRREKV